MVVCLVNMVKMCLHPKWTCDKVFKNGACKICEIKLLKIRGNMVCFDENITLNVLFKGCLLQILVGPFLNTLFYT